MSDPSVPAVPAATDDAAWRAKYEDLEASFVKLRSDWAIVTAQLADAVESALELAPAATHWGISPSHSGLIQHEGRIEDCGAPGCVDDPGVLIPRLISILNDRDERISRLLAATVPSAVPTDDAKLSETTRQRDAWRRALAAVRDDSDLSGVIGFAFATAKQAAFKDRILAMLYRHGLTMEVDQ